jgi:DNA-binding XRE family transcriptional regulator
MVINLHDGAGLASIILQNVTIDLHFLFGQCSAMDITRLIRTQGFTVAEVARLANVSRPAIYDLGNPACNPTMKTVRAVAAVLGVAPSQIRPELAE